MGSRKTRDRRDGPSDIPPDAVRKHVHEMLRSGFPSYALLDVIHTADLPDDDKETLLREGAQIVEFALANRAKVGSEISATTQTIVEFGVPEAGDAMVVWRQTVEGCISLRGLQLVAVAARRLRGGLPAGCEPTRASDRRGRRRFCSVETPGPLSPSRPETHKRLCPCSDRHGRSLRRHRSLVALGPKDIRRPTDASLIGQRHFGV